MDKMKRIGKVISILKEEEYIKHFKGCDYLITRPIEERDRKKSIRNLTYFFIICMIGIGTLAIGTNSRVLGWLTLLSFVGVFACIIYNDNYSLKYVPNKCWYFESPLPVKKPHNFKVGDVVEIKIEIKKKNGN